MKISRLFAFVCVLLTGVGSAGAQNVSIEFQDGRVRLTAQNATVSQILAEWARHGRTTIVNGERVPGGPVTLELNDVPEQQALDVVLRSASGYLVAAREGTTAGASSYDRIFILPTSSRPTNSTTPLPPPASVGAQIAIEAGESEEDFNNPPIQREPPLQRDPGGRLQRIPPPGATGRNIPPIDEADEPDEPENRPASTPGNPFGITPTGITRPGVIAPGPTPQRPREP